MTCAVRRPSSGLARLVRGCRSGVFWPPHLSQHGMRPRAEPSTRSYTPLPAREDGMNIVTTYFKVKPLQGAVSLGPKLHSTSDPAAVLRQQEYMDCLILNCRHPGVNEVHLLVEGEAAYAHLVEHVLDPSLLAQHTSRSSSAVLTAEERRKVIPMLRLHSTMPLYADLFQHANLLSQKSLTMICNADVYLSHTGFSVAAAQSLFDGTTAAARLALALTRYESEDAHDAPLIADYRGSHDAFVLVPPVPSAFVHSVAHPQNCYQAENVVIHALQQSGYQVLNPCRTLRLIHRHTAEVRQWFPSVADDGRYGKTPPITLDEAAAQLARS